MARSGSWRSAALTGGLLASVVLGLGVLVVPATAQRGAGGVPPSGRVHLDRDHRSAPPSHTYRAAVVNRTELTPTSDTDIVWPPMTLSTLSDGSTVIEGQMSSPARGRTRGTFQEQYFVFVDRDEGTYRAFKLDGPADRDPRVLEHLRSKYASRGIDWDTARARALGTGKPRALLRSIQPEPDPFARLRAATRGTRVRRASTLADYPWECYGVGFGQITTRDPLGIELAYSEAGAYVDTGFDGATDWWEGYAWWQEQAFAPTSAGTNWYFDSNSSRLSFGVDSWNAAWSTFDAHFYNDDFPAWYNSHFPFLPHLNQARTVVEHYIAAQAGTGYGYMVASPAALAGYTGFLSFDLGGSYSDDWCRSSAPPPPPQYVYGCTDASASNFNPSATANDGSCQYPPQYVYGCTDASASNFNPSATANDGSCQYPPQYVYGCTDPSASNFNPSATADDGSCQYSPQYVYGCTDPSASNYNPSANVDDGSCWWAAAIGAQVHRLARVELQPIRECRRQELLRASRDNVARSDEFGCS
jgi:hypothetical protein